MSAESAAHGHVTDFRWWQGAPDLTPKEAELRDALALRNAADERIAVLRREFRENTLAAAAAPTFETRCRKKES